MERSASGGPACGVDSMRAGRHPARGARRRTRRQRRRWQHAGVPRARSASRCGRGLPGGSPLRGSGWCGGSDHPYAAYERYRFRVPVYQEGDVLHRMLVRVDEVKESFAILRAAANDLQPGPHCAPAQPVPPGRCALGAVEGWRGEILHWVRTGEGNRLERCRSKTHR